MKEEKAWSYCLDDVNGEKAKPMTLALARRLRKLRVDKENSWRGVAYEITNGETSNQLLGMYLCRKAKDFLKGKEKEGWN